MDTSFFLGLVAGAGATLALVVWIVINRGWRHATFSGAPMPWTAILGMLLRGTPPTLIVDAYLALIKRGRSAVHWEMVEATYLGRGRRTMNAHELADLVEAQLGMDAT